MASFSISRLQLLQLHHDLAVDVLSFPMEGKVVPNVKLVAASSESGGFCCSSCQQNKPCAKAIWLARGQAWRKTCPWLQGGFNGSTNFFGLGCSVCAMMHLRKPREAAHYLEADMGKSSSNEGGTAFATFTVVPSMCMKASRFRRHASSKLHQAAVRAADSTKFPITSSAIVEFREALQQMRRGRSARDMLDGVLSDRVLLIRWCISEAVLQKYRAFLRTAEAICLMRDCRDGRLLMRFRASRASDLQAH